MTAILVTGATGFVGGGIARRLLADGREVRVLSRRPEAAAGLLALGAEVVAGDILAPESVEAAARGCEVAYHVAGMNGFCMRDPGPMRAANVAGTENVVSACGRAGVRRIVYTSSAATIGEARGVTATEDTPHRGWFLSAYERSKYEAERAAVREAERHGVELVCVNPASVQGPGRTGGTARLILDYANGHLRALVRSRFSLVDVDDCSEGHLLAEARGQAGRRYLLAGVCVTTDEAIATLTRITGIERRALTLPRPVALAAADVTAAAARVRGRRPKLCREMVATLLHGHAYDGSRATAELGLHYRSFDEMVRRTLAWYVDQGMVNASVSSPIRPA
ncbi:MAG TPA: NAD-dependent epimerase/dehydratase family protein [Gaiellales bacterium]